MNLETSAIFKFRIIKPATKYIIKYASIALPAIFTAYPIILYSFLLKSSCVLIHTLEYGIRIYCYLPSIRRGYPIVSFALVSFLIKIKLCLDSFDQFFFQSRTESRGTRND